MRPMVAFVLVALVVAVNARFLFIVTGEDEKMQVSGGESRPLKDALRVARRARVVNASPPSYTFLSVKGLGCADWECVLSCWLCGYPTGKCDPDDASLCDCYY